MKYILTLLIPGAFISCRNQSDKFDYQTSFGSNVYEAQIKYLDQTLSNYARISETGEYYYKESAYLDKTIDEFQTKIKNGEIISEDIKTTFYDHFQRTFKQNTIIDFESFSKIRQLPIKTVSEVDLLRLYIKSNFVYILLNNKLLPYNAWSTMASAKEWTIKNGQSFEVKLASTAWNSHQPNEWFLVKQDKDSLTKDNIIDTLKQDVEGVVTFTTKHYKIGKNKLIFISKLNSPTINRMLSREVVFYVK